MDRSTPPRLEEVPSEVSARQVMHELITLRWELAPMVEFYQRALGVLSVVRWMGPVSVILLGAILAALIIEPRVAV